MKSSTAKNIKRALLDFPKIVARNKREGIRRTRFVEKTFGPLARSVNRQMIKANRLREDKPPTSYHPWRLCPPGQHWVSPHLLSVPPSQKNRAGSTTMRQGHCRTNPSHRDQLYADEMNEIRDRYFSSLKGAPSPDPQNRIKHDQFDPIIRGWTRYWNEVLEAKDPLDPNLVKALIFTESSFDPNADTFAKGEGRARGLMQITDGTRKILSNEKGELNDHLVNMTDKEAYEPNINIASGVRWLFQKKKLAAVKLKRDATWFEAALEYKSYLREYLQLQTVPEGRKLTEKLQKAKKQIDKLRLYLEALDRAKQSLGK